MARGIWSGNISFGLVTIPVTVTSSENKRQELDFDLIDRRDHAHVGYQKINKKTGETIANEDIVKGLKLETGKYAVFEQDELKALRIKGTHSIDIQQFVDRQEIDPIYFKRFYYLEPGKNGEKTYVLLRETLHKTHTFGVGLIVMHSRQQLVVIGAMENALVLHELHFPDEIKKTSELDLPAEGLKSVHLLPKEVSVAEQLVEELTEPWKPIEFKDTYFRQVKEAVKKKGRKKVEVSDEKDDDKDSSDESSSKVLDLMPLLEKSLKSKSKSKSKPKAKSASARAKH